MKAEEIIKELETQFPRRLAESWDSPGVQVGRQSRTVEKVFVALDATDRVIASASDWGAELLVTHHPLLMSGVRQINEESMAGRKVLALAESGMVHYAMHTNYDVAMMGRLAERALGLKGCRVLAKTGESEDGTAIGFGCAGELPKEMSAAECCEYVKRAFGLPHVRLFGDKNTPVRRAAVCPGSGKSMIGEAIASGAQIYITGDIGHHDGLDGIDQGLVIIDAGHYGLEHLFIPQVAEYLRGKFPKLTVRTAEFEEPFQVM